MSARSDNIQTVKKNKEKYGKIENIFLWVLFALGLDIGQKKLHFLKGLEITYQSIFLSIRSDNVKSVKKNKEKYEKIQIFVFCRHVWISVESCQIFLKVLKLTIHSYFCPPDRIILSWLIKNKEKYGKIETFVFRRHVSEVRFLEITYQSIFFSARLDNIKLVKKKK